MSLRSPEPARMQTHSPLFGARVARTAWSAPETGPVVTLARPVALGRAITNLIDNALKHGRPAEVSLEVGSERGAILVSDAGQGRAAAELEALVRPFRRGNNAGTSEDFGLDLTIVQAVAEQHGGSLNFLTAPMG